MDENKKPFSDKWWTQPLGGIDNNLKENKIQQEEKKETDEFVKKYFEELEKNNES